MQQFISSTAAVKIEEILKAAKSGNNLMGEKCSKVGVMERRISESDLDANRWHDHGSVAPKPGCTKYC